MTRYRYRCRSGHEVIGHGPPHVYIAPNPTDPDDIVTANACPWCMANFLEQWARLHNAVMLPVEPVTGPEYPPGWIEPDGLDESPHRRPVKPPTPVGIVALDGGEIPQPVLDAFEGARRQLESDQDDDE
jgi:hypothetical protein